jgi:hypothetical protein
MSGDKIMSEDDWKKNYTYTTEKEGELSYTDHKTYQEYVNAHSAKLGIVKPSEPQKDA